MTAPVSATASIALPRPTRGAGSPTAVLLIGLALIAFWAGWAALFNKAQFGDNVEQFNWAQSLELGYHKHPPLPSWLLGAVVQLLGPSIYWAYLLAAACLMGSATFTWLLGRELIGATAASAATLFWGLNMTFAQRAQLYNHNTVLVLFIAATAWCAWKASHARRQPWLWWMLTGALGAGATLAKYQALVPLAGIALALLVSGRLASAAHRIGLLVATATLSMLVAPHAIWVAEHGYSTLRYASEAVAESSLAERLGFVLSFFANQVRLWSPALLALLLVAVARRYWPRDPAWPSSPAALTSGAPPPAVMAAWMAGLVGFGLVALVVMALAAGVSLRNHWGVQALQFFGLWLAWRWQRHEPIDLQRLTWAVLVVHALNLAWYAVEHRRPTAAISERRIDTAYPARRLAYAAVAHWHAHTTCPLHFVAGTAFDAGLVSLYSGGRILVFDSEAATPWVNPVALRNAGALYVLDAADAVPPEVADVISFDVVPGDRVGRPSRTIRIGVRYPASPCPTAAATGTPPRRSS